MVVLGGGEISYERGTPVETMYNLSGEGAIFEPQQKVMGPY